MSRTRIPIYLLLATLLLSLAPQARAGKSAKDLPPVYRHWLEEEVSYIISTPEHKQFLALSTNEQRDDFIQTFWKIRNPDPGSSANSYKDEHYRRLAYANENFGTPGNNDGWRTERGRIYIILGPPKQRDRHNDTANVRPMEIWFYQAETPVLPPYFSVIFFKESATEDYKLYSPRFDTPVKLCSTGETRQDPIQALKIIEHDRGAEIAKLTISLLPSEHVNLKEFQPSMESDSLLNSISNLPDNPYTQERLLANRQREHVTTSVFLGENDATISYAIFRNHNGDPTVSYLLAERLPDSRIIGIRKDGSRYYDLTLRTQLATSDGKPVYQQEDNLKGNLTEAQAGPASTRRFAAEARLPLAPGAYKLEATLTNNMDRSATRQTANVIVPVPRPGTIALSSLVAYRPPAGVPDLKDVLPFSVSHYRFTPRGAQTVFIKQGEKLALVYQLWLDPKSQPSTAADKIHLHYEFGSIAATRHETTEENEDVDAVNRDEAGNLLTGHTVDTSNLLPGTYQVVVRASREGEQRSGYATLSLHVTPTDGFADQWTAYGPTEEATPQTDDYRRGISAEALGEEAYATLCYTRSLAESSTDISALDRLVALLQKKSATASLATLGKLPQISKAPVTPATLLAIAEALKMTGDAKTTIKMLDAQLQLQEPRAELYEALAEAFQANGDASHAKEAKSKAAQLKR